MLTIGLGVHAASGLEATAQGGLVRTWTNGRINLPDAGRTVLTTSFHFVGTQDAVVERRTCQAKSGVLREDFGACVETPQNDVSGGCRPGPLSPRHENGGVCFQVRAADVLEMRG